MLFLKEYFKSFKSELYSDTSLDEQCIYQMIPLLIRTEYVSYTSLAGKGFGEGYGMMD